MAPKDKRPAQHKQPSRKGKAAWRKNIDLTGVEAKLENARAAERVGLAPVDEGTAASSLFVEDRRGDEEEHRRQQKQVQSRVKAGKRPLKSLAVLQSTSSVAPVQTRARRGIDAALHKPFSSASSSSSSAAAATTAASESSGLTPEQRARRAGIKARDIEKLRRAAGRDVRGAFGAIVEADDGEKKAGLRGPTAVFGDAYNVWDSHEDDKGKGKGKTKATATNVKTDAEWLQEALKRDPQLPITLAEAQRKAGSLALPLQGQSYNPAAAEYEALLAKALQSAQTDEERLAREREFKRKWDEGAAHAREMELGEEGRVLGMAVDAASRKTAKRRDADVSSDEDDDDEEADITDELEVSTDNGDSASEGDGKEATSAAKKLPKRKTKQQRARAQRRKEEERVQLALKKAKAARRQLASLRTLQRGLDDGAVQKAEQAAKRREAQAARLAQRVGMRKLPQDEAEVQLGEDLAESLRQLKPEGNLLKDRMRALQKRGYLEPPRSSAMSKPLKGASRKRKGYELHSYKRFE